jgi:predicted ABC-type transport system involved in lysophospholipase L1 biosynthesis ATPase subunit
MLSPTSRQGLLDGESIGDLHADGRAGLRARVVGFVFHRKAGPSSWSPTILVSP